MTATKRENGDEKNSPFGFPKNLSHLKPGIDSSEYREVEVGKNHRLRPSKKEIPQKPLADRLRKPRKGE
jgi:hypothetical protein